MLIFRKFGYFWLFLNAPVKAASDGFVCIIQKLKNQHIFLKAISLILTEREVTKIKYFVSK
jgi:hypothetical protein